MAKWNIAQSKILTSDLTKDHIVVGGPGTGKSILALTAAEMIAKTGKRVLLLMYNRSLRIYMDSLNTSAVKEKISIRTYHKWLHNEFSRSVQISLPLSDSDKNDYDWERIKKGAEITSLSYDAIVIDEAQDFPIELIDALYQMCHNMIVFIDPNQAMSAKNTNIDSIMDILETEKPYKLLQSYRGSKEMLEAAGIFATNKVSNASGNYHGERIDLICTGLKPDRFCNQNEMMRSLIAKHFGEEIGIIVNSGSYLRKTYTVLNEMFGAIMPVQKYDSSDTDYTDDISFGTPGIKILSFGTVRGLEFDTVIVPNIDQIYSKDDAVIDSNSLYVAMTRARKKTYLLYGDINQNSSKWAYVMRKIYDNKQLFDWFAYNGIK